MSISNFIIFSAFFLPAFDETEKPQTREGLENLFLREAPKKWKIYQEKAKHLQGSWKEVRRSFLNPEIISQTYFEMKQRDGCAFILEQGLEGGNNPRQNGEIRIVNPRYQFILQRFSKNKPWIVKGVGPKLWKPSTINDPIYFVDLVNRLPFTFGAVVFSLPITVLDPGFKIKKVEPFPFEGKKMVKVEFTYFPPDQSPKKVLRGGWVLLDPQQYWIIRKFEVETDWGKDKASDSTNFEYQEIGDGFSIIKRIVARRQNPNRPMDMEFRFIYDLQKRAVPERDFTLSAFGFPEPKGMEPSQSSLWFLWIFLGALVCFSLVFIFLRKSKPNRNGEKNIPTRPAYTLVEILVVIGIIGVLIALLVPAVQKVREASLRLECANNLKQIGLACHQYHNSHGWLPAGVSSGNGANPMRLSSWLTQILPYMEQDNLWQITLEAYRQNPNPFKNPPHVGLATVIPSYNCPTDRRAFQAQTALVDKIPVAFTFYLGVEGKDLYARDGVLFRDSHIRFADITDGTSQTLLAGERPPSTNNQFGWWYAGAGQKFTGSADMVLGVQEQNALPITAGSCPPGTYPFEPGNPGNQCDMFHFWSLHSGGANFLFCDGSVHFLSYAAAPLLPALASRSGDDPVSFDD